MRKVLVLILALFFLVNASGCAPLIIGGAVGVLGGYGISRDTIQGETDTSYDSLWSSALAVSRIRGVIQQEDYAQGYIEMKADSSRVWIRLVRLTQATTRLKVSARKYRLPNISLAQDIFVKIMEAAQERTKR